MTRSLIKMALVLSAAGILAGCTGYNKILKSQDPDLKYRKAMEFFELGKYNKTTQLLEDISHIYAGTPREDSLAYYLGLAYYKNGDFDMSGYIFDRFRKTYGRSPFLEDAEYMYAKGFYFMSPAANRDQSATMQALMAIDEYSERYPNSIKKEALQENIDELVGKLHDKAFINAKTYYTIGRYKSAVVALKNALNQFPESSHREELMFLIVKSSYLLADNSVAYLQRDRYLDMMDAYYNFVSEYKTSPFTKDVEKMHESAKIYLARFTDGENVEIIEEDPDYGD